ncbi:MAG: hypothetical protein WC069_02430 [Candidatus Shapirobacteria bacterium]
MIKKYKILIILFLLLIPTFFFFLRPGLYWNMHDDMQIIRQLEMEKCLKDGQIPCRWTPDLGFGYGYPLFNFYPPLPYIVGQIFRQVGFSFVTAIKLTVVFQIIASAGAMYLLGSAIFGPMGGLISAVFYAYAPYRSVNIFVRGAMNEAWASVFFPLIFYFSRKIIIAKKFEWKNILLLSLSISGLLLSHNPMALTFLPFVAMWCLYLFFENKTNLPKKILYLITSSLLALATTAFYTIPVLLESKYVQIESMFQNYYHYSVHFVSFSQLFLSNFWGDGPSVWGTNDGMPFMIGYVHWIVPLILIFISLFFLLKKQYSPVAKITILLGLMGFFAALMTHQKSGILWQYITPIQKIQFPWRFLSHSSFILALTAGSLAIYTKNNKWIISLVFASIVILNWNHLTPITYGPITDNQKLTGLAWQNQITSGIYDYLPKTASTAPKKAAEPIVDHINIASKDYQVTGLKNGTDWTLFNINLNQPALITLSRLSYPGWQVTDFGKNIESKIEPELGRIQISLPSGNHQIYLKLHNTTTRTISNFISLAAIILMLVFFISTYERRRNIRTKK